MRFSAFIKKVFRLNNWKRILILVLTIGGAITAIAAGSSFYTAQNVSKSLEYGGGAEYIVGVSSNSDVLKVDDVAQNIYDRLNLAGIRDVRVRAESGENASVDQGQIRVSYSNVKSSDEIATVLKAIVDKPRLAVTDIWGNPLFTGSGNFDALRLNTSTKAAVRPLDTLDWSSDTFVPLANNPASPTYGIDNSNFSVINRVQVRLETGKAAELTNATRYISSLPAESQHILVWADMNQFIRALKTTRGSAEGSTLWSEAGGDPYKAAHVNNNPAAPLRDNPNFLFSSASNYLLADVKITAAVNTGVLTIEGGLSIERAISLAQRVNFSAATYALTPRSSAYVEPTYGSDAFRNALIALIVIFSVIAIFLVVNYGLLGGLATIAIALFMFLVLTLFTVMRGEYSPESIVALVIGMGLATNAAILKFERLKNEVYAGTRLIKSTHVANRRSLATVADASVTTAIVAAVLFYLGQQQIVGFSVMLMLCALFSLVVVVAFNSLTATYLVGLGIFEKRLAWLGIKPKFDTGIQKKIARLNFVQMAKWLTIVSALLIVGGLVTFGAIAGIDGNVKSGIVLGQAFEANTVITFNVTTSGATTREAAEGVLKAAGYDLNRVVYGYTDGVISSLSLTSADLSSSFDVSAVRTIWGDNLNVVTTSNDFAEKLAINSVIAIAIAFVALFIYVWIRFGWTFAIAALLSLIHDGLIITALFIMSRQAISPLFIAGLLAALGASISDTVITFDRIRERMKVHLSTFDKPAIKSLANIALAETFKRSFVIMVIGIVSFVIFTALSGTATLSMNLAMLFGLVIGTYSSLFIAAFVWVYLEVFRQKRRIKREQSKFWNVSKVEEQIIAGVNDYKP